LRPIRAAKIASAAIGSNGTLFPAAPTGLDSPQAPDNGCVGIISCGTSLVDEAIADFEDVNVGLDKLLQLYCSGRASWGAGDAVTKTYCKDTSSTTCPTSKPTSVGAITDYPHLWAAGELAIRKGSLGARLPVFRERLKCGSNDGDMGFAGYALFILGHLGDDAGAKSFLQTKASAGGDLGSVAKAALYMMGDTAQKADVQAGVQSSSVFVKVACAAALGIVDKDDASILSALIPEVKFNNPTDSAEDGKGMYAAHILEIVAFDRRGWKFKGVGDGAVTFYGETGSAAGNGGASGTGGASGAGGTTGSQAGGGGTRSGNGGAVGNGGRSGGGGVTAGAAGASGRSGEGGAGAAGVSGRSGDGGATAGTVGSSGVGGGGNAGGAAPQSAGGAAGSGGNGSGGNGSGGNGSGGSIGQGGANAASGGTTASSGSTTGGGNADGSGCRCNLGGRAEGAGLLALVWLAVLLARRGRR
jgi:hypothetical protein